MKEVLTGKYVDELLLVARNCTDPATAYDKALRAKSLGRVLGDLGLQAHADLVLGEILTRNAAYEQALEHCLSSLAYFVKSGQSVYVVNCWRSMAIVYGRLGLREEQLHYNNKCMKLLATYDDAKEELRIKNNIGYGYYEMGRIEKAVEVFDSILIDDRASDWLLCVVLKNLASCYYRMDDYELSRQYAEEGFELSVLVRHEVSMSACNYWIAVIDIEQGLYKEAREKLHCSLEVFEGRPSLNEGKGLVLEALIKTYLHLKDVDGLSVYFQEYSEFQKQSKDLELRKAAQAAKFQIDITEISKQRKELEASNDLLQASNEELARQQSELDQKARWLELVNSDLHSYAHTVAHDLKQPIRTIKGFANLLEESLASKVNSNEKKWLGFLCTATDHMDQLVVGLLEFAQMGDKMPKVRVDVAKVLKQVLLNLESLIREKQGQIVVEATPDLHSNSTLILQVFQNLISNALKFHKPDVPPVIHISGKWEEERAVYEIKDNGLGIPECRQRSIFDLFSRLEETSDQEGSGIGLATVWRLMKQTGGELQLVSKVDEGTCFVLRF